MMDTDNYCSGCGKDVAECECKPFSVSDGYLPSATDWHGGNEIIQEHWQELVWQAYWFLSVHPNENLFWLVAMAGSSGLAVQVVKRLSR